jgi:hypothetical protein
MAPWSVDGSGNLIVTPDNAHDIGTNGAVRPRNLYLGGDLLVAGRVGIGGNTDPAYALRVVGAMWMNGSFSNTGDASVGGNISAGGSITLGGPMVAQYFNATGGAFWSSGGADFQMGQGLSTQWKIPNGTGLLQPQSDNQFDIGDGTHAIRDLYAKGSVSLYNAFTDVNNYERLRLYWSANAAGISTEKLGTGVARQLAITAGAELILRGTGTTGWYIAGSLVTEVDNAVDIGAPGAHRPRNIYAAGVVRAGAVTIMGNWVNGNGAVASSLPPTKGTGGGGPVDGVGDGWLVLDASGTPIYVPYWV